MALLDASRKKAAEDRKFLAAIQGIELDEVEEEPVDVADLRNSFQAKQEGFGEGEGLGFMTLGGED